MLLLSNIPTATKISADSVIKFKIAPIKYLSLQQF